MLSFREYIDKALGDEYSFVREAAIKHPKATSKNINKALDDEYDGVRFSALGNRNATKEHFTKALNDSDEEIRDIAKERLTNLQK